MIEASDLIKLRKIVAQPCHTKSDSGTQLDRGAPIVAQQQEFLLEYPIASVPLGLHSKARSSARNAFIRRRDNMQCLIVDSKVLAIADGGIAAGLAVRLTVKAIQIKMNDDLARSWHRSAPCSRTAQSIQSPSDGQGSAPTMQFRNLPKTTFSTKTSQRLQRENCRKVQLGEEDVRGRD